MPESVRDRCTRSHEFIYMLTKKPRYFYDAEAIKETVSEHDQRRSNEPVNMTETHCGGQTTCTRPKPGRQTANGRRGTPAQYGA